MNHDRRWRGSLAALAATVLVTGCVLVSNEGGGPRPPSPWTSLHLTLSAPQAIGNGNSGDTLLRFDEENGTDTLDEFDLETATFTPRSSGLYLVVSRVTFGNADTIDVPNARYVTRLRVNGKTVSTDDRWVEDAARIRNSKVLELRAGDAVTLTVAQWSRAATQPLNERRSETYLQIVRLR